MNLPLTFHAPLHLTWDRLIARWRARYARHPPHRPARASDETLDVLVELDARTLDDIGAPQELLARAMAHREARRHDLEDLRAGLASGAGWRHW